MMLAHPQHMQHNHGSMGIDCSVTSDTHAAGDDGSDSEHDSGQGADHRRRELPPEAVSILKGWLLSPEHFEHPYPSPQDQQRLLTATGIGKKQLKNWFTNARRRIWKPLMKKRQEQLQCLRFHAVSGLGTFELSQGLSLQRSPIVPWAASINTTVLPSQSELQQHARDTIPEQKEHVSFAARAENVERVDSYAILESLLDDEQPSSDTSSESTDAGRGSTSKKRSAEVGEQASSKRPNLTEPCVQDGCSPDYTYTSDVEQHQNPQHKSCRTATYHQADGQELPFVVPVSPTYQCLFCSRTGVDTQLLPCQHLFHGSCLRSWLLCSEGPPQCPSCCSTIGSCVLALVYVPMSNSSYPNTHADVQSTDRAGPYAQQQQTPSLTGCSSNSPTCV